MFVTCRNVPVNRWLLRLHADLFLSWQRGTYR